MSANLSRLLGKYALGIACLNWNPSCIRFDVAIGILSQQLVARHHSGNPHVKKSSISGYPGSEASRRKRSVESGEAAAA
jgi:hypothetical protein